MKERLNNLFKFPIIRINVEVEESKSSMAINNDPELVYAEAEVPYDRFLYIEDRWLPIDESYKRALIDGIFDACFVVFEDIGEYIVPMNKERFKLKYISFIEKLQKNES